MIGFSWHRRALFEVARDVAARRRLSPGRGSETRRAQGAPGVKDVGHCGVVVDGETMKGPTLKKIMNTTDVPTTLIRPIVRFVLPENIRPVEFTGARHE